MIRWLWKIIVGKSGCGRLCQWEVQSERDIRSSGEAKVIGTSYVLRCKTCGDLKHKSFYP